jgi:hypothetical protein
MPSLPKKFAPQVHTVPSDLRMIVPLAPPQIEITSALRADEASERINNPTAVRVLYRMVVGRSFYSRPLRFRSGLLWLAVIILALGFSKFRSFAVSILQAITDLGLLKTRWAFKAVSPIRVREWDSHYVLSKDSPLQR